MCNRSVLLLGSWSFLRLYLNEFNEGQFLRLSSSEFHMAIEDGIHDFLNNSVRQNGVAKLFRFLRG